MSSADSTPAARSFSAAGGTAASSRATVSRRRVGWSSASRSRGARSIASEPAVAGIPVLLEVADERGAEVAEGLLARVGRHVGAKQVERLLAGPQRAAVRGGVDQAGAREEL